MFLFYFCGFCSIKLFFISYLPHNLIVQCFTHARLGLRECQVVSVVCEVYCVLYSRELNYYLDSSCFSLVYLRPIFRPTTVVSEGISPFLFSIPPRLSVLQQWCQELKFPLLYIPLPPSFPPFFHPATNIMHFYSAYSGCTPTERHSKILLFSKIKGGDYSEGYLVPTERRGVSKWMCYSAIFVFDHEYYRLRYRLRTDICSEH